MKQNEFVFLHLLFALYIFYHAGNRFENFKEGVRFEFRTSVELFNQQHFKARTKMSVQTVCGLLFANDCARVAHTLEDMQWIANKFSHASKAFSLVISIKKT